MPTVNVYSIAKKKVGTVDLDDAVFGAPVREHLFYEIVRYQRNKARSGNHATKGRAQVSGGGKKPWRQKGTGRARQGSTRSPQWAGGGVVHGPIPRSHAHDMTKKARRAALVAALSRRCAEEALTIFDAFELEGIKTKGFVGVMKAFEIDDLLLVLPEANETVSRSARNLPGVTVLPVAGLNVLDILRHKNLALTKDAVERITARFRKHAPEPEEEPPAAKKKAPRKKKTDAAAEEKGAEVQDG
jgi:large subunit ribosomal protein L4